MPTITKSDKKLTKDKKRQLKERMLVVQRRFPYKNYTEVYLSHYPGEDAELIRRVWNVVKVSEKITKNFETLIQRLLTP